MVNRSFRQILLPALALAAAGLSLPAQAPVAKVADASPDPAKLLHEVAQNYASATTVRVQEIKEETFSNALYYQWNKSYLTLVTASGNRFRIEGRSGWGEYLQTSDGRTETISSSGNRKYVQHASLPSGPTLQHIMSGGSQLVWEAWGILHTLESQAAHATDATALPDEIVTIGGISFDCFVVRAKRQKSGEDPPPKLTFWIDKRSKVIRKSTSRGKTYLVGDEANEEDLVDSELFPVVDLDAKADPSEFVQPSPQGERVASLEPTFPDANGKEHRTVQQVPAAQVLGTLQGQPRPLGSYKGHPLIIDFWATWCGPCMEAMPAFARLQEQAAKAGVIVLSIDEDEDADAATNYLMLHKYAWQNFHDDRGLMRRFGVPSIPTEIVVDAEGKVIFNGNPDADHDALYAALRKVDPQLHDAAAR